MLPFFTDAAAPPHAGALCKCSSEASTPARHTGVQAVSFLCVMLSRFNFLQPTPPPQWMRQRPQPTNQPVLEYVPPEMQQPPTEHGVMLRKFQITFQVLHHVEILKSQRCRQFI